MEGPCIPSSVAPDRKSAAKTSPLPLGLRLRCAYHRVMYAYALLCILAIVTLSANTLAQAQGAQAPRDKTPQLTISAGPFAGLSFGTQFHQWGSDTAGGSSTSGLYGLRLSPRWRAFNDDFGIGFSTSVAWLESHELSSTNWYDGQLAVRYYLGRARRSQGWLDATLGVMVAVERIDAFRADTGASIPKRSVSDWAPAGSLALGYDGAFGRYFGFAPEVRVSYYGLSHTNGILHYDPQTVVSVGLSLLALGFYH